MKMKRIKIWFVQSVGIYALSMIEFVKKTPNLYFVQIAKAII
jgi:hypothetical protein